MRSEPAKDAINAISIQQKVNNMPECPCCSEKLLRHVRQGKVYWFCTHCWQEMPDLTTVVYQSEKEPVLTGKR